MRAVRINKDQWNMGALESLMAVVKSARKSSGPTAIFHHLEKKQLYATNGKVFVQYQLSDEQEDAIGDIVYLEYIKGAGLIESSSDESFSWKDLDNWFETWNYRTSTKDMPLEDDRYKKYPFVRLCVMAAGFYGGLISPANAFLVNKIAQSLDTISFVKGKPSSPIIFRGYRVTVYMMGSRDDSCVMGEEAVDGNVSG